METQHDIDRNIPYKELVKLRKQTHCFVCKESFKEDKDRHLHHDHKQEKGNIIAYACSRCNMQMTEKHRGSSCFPQWIRLCLEVRYERTWNCH